MTVPPAGTAPAGGNFSLPALSAPKSRLGRVWVRRKSHRILHRKKSRKLRKIRLKSKDFSRIWSECRDSNPRPLGPKPGAIPTSLYPDIQFLPLYHGGGKNQRFFCLWSFMWSKLLLYRFRQPMEIPQTQVLQGFAAFRLALPRIAPRHSQMSRPTS